MNSALSRLVRRLLGPAKRPVRRHAVLRCEPLEPRHLPSGIPFVISNQTGQQVNFALYGMDNQTGQWSYFSGADSGANSFSGSLTSSKQLGSGHNLPTYSFTGPTATLNLPNTAAGISSAVLVLTVGDIAPSIMVAPDYTLPRPSPSNPTLVNATTNPYYDFIEFTLNSSGTLFINTTQVDQFGFPITLSSSPQGAGAPVGVTPGFSRDAIFAAFSTFLGQQSDPAAGEFLPLIQNAASGSPYRIIAPGQYLAMPGKSADPLNHYFDTTLTSFFAAPPPLKLTALNPFSNGDPGTYTFIGTATTHNPVASGDLVNGAADTNPADNRNFAVLDFVGQAGDGSLTGTHFYIYNPMSAPSWVNGLSAGEQVFANNGVFADNVARFGSGLQSIVLGNLENQVVSALTRGIATSAAPGSYATTTAFWTDPAQAFPNGVAENLYAKFLHTGTINGQNIFIGGRVYAFPYSDQGDRAAFFTVTNPSAVNVTLGPWSGGTVTQASPTITSAPAPTSASVGTLYQYAFTASGTPTPTLSASGLPSWLTFNPATGLLSGTPTAAQAGSSSTITLSAHNGVGADASMTFTLAVPAAATPFANTLYLLGSNTLSAQPGAAAQSVTIASAGGTNHDGTPTNALVYQLNGLTGTYDPTKQTLFNLFLDAGSNVADGTQLRVSYDFTGDGTFDRVETYRYFAEDNRVGWEAYTQNAGLKSASGAFANLNQGNVKVEIWNAIGATPVLLRTSASAADGLQSEILLPFMSGVAASPVLSVSPTALSLGTTVQGTAGSAQSFVIRGSSLGSAMVVTAPPRVEVSRDGVNFGSVISLAPDSSGTVPATTLYVRIAASAPAGGMSGSVAVTSSGATPVAMAVTGAVTANVVTQPFSNALYLLGGAAPSLATQAGSAAQMDTIASAGSVTHDGTPTNARVYQIRGLTGTYDPTQQTRFNLFLDAGTQVANGTQVRISYDFNGDGIFDRVETYRYFAEDDRVGWEVYTRNSGVLSAVGSFANMTNGTVKVEVWNAIGKGAVSLRTNASATDGMQSQIWIPFV